MGFILNSAHLCTCERAAMLTRSRSHSREESEAVSDSQSSSGYSSSLSQSQSQEDSAPKEEYVPKKKKPRGRGPPVQPDQWVCLMPGRYRPHVPQKNEIVHFENFFGRSVFQRRCVHLVIGVIYLRSQHFPLPPSRTQELVELATT